MVSFLMFSNKNLCTFLTSPCMLHVLPFFHSLSNHRRSRQWGEGYELRSFSLYNSLQSLYSDRSINESVLLGKIRKPIIVSVSGKEDRLLHVIYLFSMLCEENCNYDGMTSCSASFVGIENYRTPVYGSGATFWYSGGLDRWDTRCF
jgi:hypothetical protein